jgi:multiple antibiotic resistance protein
VSYLTAAFLSVIIGLFPIVNPLGMAPIFLQVTADVSTQARNALAGRVAFGGFLLMVGSFFIGSHVLAFFGLTMPAVQVAGGLIVLSAGWRMLQQGDDAPSRGSQSKLPDNVALTRAFFPLTMPLTVGPGTISVAITLGSKATQGDEAVYYVIGGLFGCLAIALLIFVSYRFAEKVLGLLGQAGTDVVLRLSAFIMLCLGVQIVWRGLASMLGHA